MNDALEHSKTEVASVEPGVFEGGRLEVGKTGKTEGQKPKKAKAVGGQKPKILFWRGVLGDNSRTLRLVAVAVLAVSIASLSFTQMGFIGIGIDGNYAGYAVIILLPVALGALLLGTGWGTALGLFAGAMLYAHVLIMPLNYYEWTFVNQFSSMIMLTICGFLLGILFAFALRHNPGPIKRAVYIIIVCFAVAAVYSMAFMINSFVVLVEEIMKTGYFDAETGELSAMADRTVYTILGRVGSLEVQLLITGAAMALLCVLGDIITEKVLQIRGNVGVRAVFASWMLIVVSITFMITNAFGFASISGAEITSASETMQDKADYLCSQLNEVERHYDSIYAFLEKTGIDAASISEDAVTDLSTATSIEGLLDGYSVEEDGLVLITTPLSGDIGSSMVLLSDDELFVEGEALEDALSDEMLRAVQDSLADEDAHRVIYDGHVVDVSTAEDSANRVVKSEIAYLCAQEVSDYGVVVIWPSSMVFAGRDAMMAWTSISLFVMLAVVFLLTANLQRRIVVRRIDETNEVLAQVTEGNLDAKVDIRDTREFSSLSDGINETVGALKGWIAEAESRMDAELATAKAIQEAALPRVFPPFPDIRRFDIYASMNAAKEVGGDFYDFFLIGDEAGPEAGKLGFVLADVSGKGVPAALFMMKSQTLIRDYLENGMEVGEALENANRQLCDGNDSGMFVTVWVGVLDYATGHVDYVNAGHNPPLLWSGLRKASAADAGQAGSDEPGGTTGWRWLTEKSGMPLGLFDGFPYTAYSMECQIGDQILLYTDGVTEAMSVNGELYGEERLKSLLDENCSLHPRLLLETVRQDVARHARGAEQSDDITILALEVGVPPEITATLTVAADAGQLPRVNEFIHTELDRRLCPVRAQRQIDIAVEELFVNVCNYAYQDAPEGTPKVAHICYTYSADPPSITVDIIDDGMPYNPLAKPDAVTPDDIMDVPIGGLGILMAKRSVNDMRYERIDGSNVVTIVKNW